MTRNPDKIINIVCHVTGVSIDDIKRSVYGTGQRDCQNCIDARQIAMFFIKELNPQIPHEQIAIMFNKRLKNGIVSEKSYPKITIKKTVVVKTAINTLV